MAGGKDDLRVGMFADDVTLSKNAKAAAKALRGIGTASDTASAKTTKGFVRMGKSAVVASRIVKRSVGTMLRSLTSLQGMLIGGGLILGFKKAVDSAVSFEKGLAEISTLIDKNVVPTMDTYKSALEEMVKTSSRSLQDLTRGLYQTISSGVTDTAKALRVLDLSQRAAVAGLTDVSVAVDAMTTLVNAFQLSEEGATRASDLLFTTVKRGKTCVTGDTRVLLADGRYERIDRLGGINEIVAWDGRNFSPVDSSWVCMGEKSTFVVTTKSGRTITTTPEHPYLTRDGWREVEKLKPGDAIAVPVSLPFFGDVVPSDGWPTLLGYLISEGSIKHSGSPQVHNKNKRVIEECSAAAGKLGVKMNLVATGKTGCESYNIVAGPRGGRSKNPVIEQLREWGLWGTGCDDKFIPDECFTWRRQHVAELLRALFNGDGWLCDVGSKHQKTSIFQLGYGSNSERLIRDVSHLLTRFGIFGSVRRKAKSWTWVTRRYVDIRRFVEFIGIDRPSADDVLSTKFMEWTPRGFIRSDRRDRGNLQRGTRDFKQPIFYDKIASIKPGPTETVYDLTVPVLHNFVANDIVAHNTFEPLANNIGKVATIASQAGVEMEEMFASIATLTKAGLSVDIATTSLRQLFTNLLKPSQEAKESLRALNIEWGDAALRGGNFTKTLEKMHEATGGNAEVLTHLVPNIRALQAAMVLSGDQIEVFKEDLDQMADSAGAAEEAFRKMSETSAEKLAVQWQRLALLAQKLGAELLPHIVEWLTDFASWAENHGPEIIETFRGIGSSLVLIKDIIWGIGGAIKYIMGLAIESMPGGQVLLALLKKGTETGAGARARQRERDAGEQKYGQQLAAEAIGGGGLAGVQEYAADFGEKDARAFAKKERRRLIGEAARYAKMATQTLDYGPENIRDFELANRLLAEEAKAVQHLINTYSTLSKKEKENMSVALDAAKKRLEAQEAAQKAVEKNFENTINMLKREMDKRGDAFEKLDAWYKKHYETVKNNREGLAMLDQVYFDKLEKLAVRAHDKWLKGVEKIARAWKKFHKEEDAWAKGRVGIGTSTLAEHRAATASDRDMMQKAEQRQMLASAGMKAGGSVVQGAVQGAQTGGGIGAVIGIAIALGFEDNRKAFAEDWDKRMKSIRRLTGNVLKNLTSMIRIALSELPAQILQGLGDIDLADLIINGVFKGIKKFFTGKDTKEALKNFFTGGKKGFGKSGLATIGTFGISRLFHEGGIVGAERFHDGGLVGGLRELAAALPRAHDGLRITPQDLGLKADERFIVAQTQERVLNREETAAYDAGVSAGGGVNIKVQLGGDGSVVMAKDADRLVEEVAAAAASSRHGNAFKSALNQRSGRVPGRNMRRR